jgi:hypothetical protein
MQLQICYNNSFHWEQHQCYSWQDQLFWMFIQITVACFEHFHKTFIDCCLQYAHLFVQHNLTVGVFSRTVAKDVYIQF